MLRDHSALAATLRELEQRLLDPRIRVDRAAVAALLTEDFLEFGSSGRVFDREAILVALGAEPDFTEPLLEDLRIEDLRILVATDDLAVISYRLSRPAFHGHSRHGSLRSSTWVREGERWRMRFHQGTREAEAVGVP